MKKNKFLVVAIIGVFMAIGMVMVSCSKGCPGDGTCSGGPANEASCTEPSCSNNQSGGNSCNC